MSEFDKLLILGHTGFIGGALYRYFAEKDTTPVLGHSSSTVDLRSPHSLERLGPIVTPKTALILASAVTREKNDTLEAFQANVAMVTHLAQFLERVPVGLCVYFSSISVYGDSQTDLSIHEETRVDPDSLYALAKYVGEFILRDVAERKRFRLLTLRAAHVYGPGDTHATYGPMQFIRSLMDERNLYLFGDGEELRDRLYIHDLVYLTDCLMSGGASGLYNLVTGESHSFREIADYLSQIAPFNFRIIHRPRKKLLIRPALGSIERRVRGRS